MSIKYFIVPKQNSCNYGGKKYQIRQKAIEGLEFGDTFCVSCTFLKGESCHGVDK